MIADGEQLAALLPQRPPMVLIHQLVSCDAERTVSRFRVTSESVLAADGFLTEAGLIENIAQTAAAGSGFSYQQQGKPTPVGYIAAIKDLTIWQLPGTGTEITTEIRVQNQVMEFSIVRGKVSADEVTFAECEMRIFIKDPA
jgi:predicted hotdog family 3-hydroxylacyl-ACP dehydratase